MERRLYRSEHDRIVFGVCGGLGEYFNTDPVIIRVIAVLIIIFSGFVLGLLAYVIMALIIPLRGTSTSSPADVMRENAEDIRDRSASIGQEIRNTFERKENSSRPRTHAQSTNNILYLLGIIIIAIGAFVLFGIIFSWFWRIFWPVLLIVAGLVILLLVWRRPKR